MYFSPDCDLPPVIVPLPKLELAALEWVEPPQVAGVPVDGFLALALGHAAGEVEVD